MRKFLMTTIAATALLAACGPITETPKSETPKAEAPKVEVSTGNENNYNAAAQYLSLIHI